MKHDPIREEIERIYGKVSPFELKEYLIQLASREGIARTLLNAGRGNPNWTASGPREAYFLFGQFAVNETRRVIDEGNLAGMPKKEGIYERFKQYISHHHHSLLNSIIEYGVKEKQFNPDEWVYELVDGIIGDHYPFPDRMLTHIERVVLDYLNQELCYNCKSDGRFKIFAVEGATAAMCYIFDTLIANELLYPGDEIAIMVPIFTPYLEIPHIPRYNFKVTMINASETKADRTHTWQYPKEELEKLKNPNIKALFVVNPSNPPSVAMKQDSISELVKIVKNDNPHLMIISDDVYGTFVKNFSSLIGELPYNTIGVYSYSKYFGVTGWRLGTIAIHEENVFDELLKKLPEDKKVLVNKRYESMSSEPETIAFIDRIVADSRQVALNHTAGLSTPQQVQMAFFSIFSLLDQDNVYKNQTIAICRRRQKLLFQGLGLKLTEDPNDAAYYTEFNLLEWAYKHYGEDFANFLEENYRVIDILIRLAEEESIVLLNGGAFFGPEWSIRISLANLDDEAYLKIGEYLHQVLEDYVKVWQTLKTNENC